MSAATPKTAPRKLPPDPSPYLSAKASEAPALEAELVADKSYTTIWDEKHLDDRNLVFSAISELLITEELESDRVFIPENLVKELERRKLMNMVLKVSAIIPRTGALPGDFAAKAKGSISSLASEPRHGVWSPKKAGTAPIDFAGLAYYLNPEDADYMREFITARSGGPIGWENSAKPVRPYLVRERAALERLALIGTLTTDEAARLAELKASKLGDAPPEEIDLAKLLKEYGSNEVRADDSFKGHVVEFGGVAGALERGTIGGITLAIGTGKAFEHPQVHCFFERTQTEKVKALNKGDRVRVRGKVDGLVMNVIIRYCELVE
ncbi:MAG: hypothetical protein KIT84_43150 [Labilithrix sp.]|nr:hypothetical protein [Labilithrix sp.]MCW5817876.1 hypothetical protein [Labilithrix sp.]